MTCQETRPLFVRYLDDDLGLEDRLAVERHTASCYECHEDLRDLRVLLAAAHEALTPPPATHRFEDLVPLLHSEPPVHVHQTSVWRSLSRLVAAAAVVVALIAVTDMALDGIHRASVMVERAITEEPTPSENATGVLGWPRRIAWAAEDPANQTSAQPQPALQKDTAPEAPAPERKNTSQLPEYDRSGMIVCAAHFDRNETSVPYNG